MLNDFQAAIFPSFLLISGIFFVDFRLLMNKNIREVFQALTKNFFSIKRHNVDLN